MSSRKIGPADITPKFAIFERDRNNFQGGGESEPELSVLASEFSLPDILGYMSKVADTDDWTVLGGLPWTFVLPVLACEPLARCPGTLDACPTLELAGESVLRRPGAGDEFPELGRRRSRATRPPPLSPSRTVLSLFESLEDPSPTGSSARMR